MRIKLRYLVRSGGLNFMPSVRGPVRKIYTTIIDYISLAEQNRFFRFSLWRQKKKNPPPQRKTEKSGLATRD